MPSPTSKSTVELELAAAMVRRLDFAAHRRIARARARLSGCASTLLDVEREVLEIFEELTLERPDLLGGATVINLESPAGVAEWRPGDSVSIGIDGPVRHTDPEAFLAAEVRDAGGLADRVSNLMLAAGDILWAIDGSKPSELAGALLYNLEQLPSEQVERIRARVRECAG